MAPVKKPLHSRSPTFLREWREFRDLSQEEVADRLEIDRTTLSKIERRLLPYNQDFLERAALVYGCEPADILNTNPMKPAPPRLVFEALKSATPDQRQQITRFIEFTLSKAS
jgi:transcriptional regulator with XRE-family HTH domain